MPILALLVALLLVSSTGDMPETAVPAEVGRAGSDRSHPHRHAVVTPAERSLRHDAVPVLMYHVLADPPVGAPFPELYVKPADFLEHVTWLEARGFQAVTLSQVVAHWSTGSSLPDRPVVLTFDDGYSSVATVAGPVLRRLDWPGVLNLKVGNVGDAVRVDEVRALVDDGWEIGAHTITHPVLPMLGAAALRTETRGSKRALENAFGVPVRVFCYPSGRYDARVIRAVRAAGFVAATTTEPGFARRDEPFTLDRVRVGRSDGLAAIVAALDGPTPRSTRLG